VRKANGLPLLDIRTEYAHQPWLAKRQEYCAAWAMIVPMAAKLSVVRCWRSIGRSTVPLITAPQNPVACKTRLLASRKEATTATPRPIRSNQRGILSSPNSVKISRVCLFA
jgi:hypothetical protein